MLGVNGPNLRVATLSILLEVPPLKVHTQFTCQQTDVAVYI